MTLSWPRVPLAPLAVAFAVGVAASGWVRVSVAAVVLAVALAWGASLLVLGRLAPATACLLAGLAAVGAIRASPWPLASDHIGRLDVPAVARVTGRLATEPVVFAAERTRVLLDVERVGDEPRSGRLPVTLYGVAPPLTEGQQVAGEMRLHAATGFRNPGGFDYGEFLRREGMPVVASARVDRLIALDDPGPRWNVRVRRAAREAIARTLPPTSAALLSGLLLGDRGDLPPEVDDGFRRAGVYHVLAVSGFNVALIAGAVFSVLTLARCGRRVAAVAAIAAVLGFAFVVGPEPSVLRAVVMGVLVLGAVLLERDASVLNGLALAALLILAVRPNDLADPGFQLSFAATAGIVLAPLPRGLVWGSLGVSIAAQLAVLPIALWHFNQLSTIGPIANLGVVPLAGLATILGLLAVTVAFFTDAGGAVFLDALWPLLLAMRALVTLAARVPGALVHLPAPHWTAITAYGLGLVLALGWWRWRETRPEWSRWAGALALGHLVVAVTIGAWPLVRPPDGRLRLTVLDVGQGDAIVIQAPDGRTVVVDAGPGGGMRLDTGARVLAPFLWNHGVLRLAGLVTTHDDQDHAGGSAALRREFTIGDQLAGPERIWMGGVSVLPLTATDKPAGSRRNDDALVFRVDYGAVSFLLTSDIGAEVESRLIRAQAPLAVTVLKVAHHGARTSSTPPFLEKVKPALAVISVGRRNPYGHPSPDTLARLAATGARIYRTDRDGAVIFETDGFALTVIRWATREVEHFCLNPDGGC
ncbi:MAG: DNA internalization-related competence protein ComEC/Rec2 [Candidatus Rokuibacteriota bacterium]|nr:MAG: DNA internalization-related competence protein ComEC/Rec2 [Candidatus Rokubacteria bacterium]